MLTILDHSLKYHDVMDWHSCKTAIKRLLVSLEDIETLLDRIREPPVSENDFKLITELEKDKAEINDAITKLEKRMDEISDE